MKNTAKTNVENLIETLMQTEAQCVEAGMNAAIDDGTVYALKEYRGRIYVSDGKRWIENAALVRSIDVYENNLVSVHYYLKHMPTFPADRVREAGMRAIIGTDLLDYFDIKETVVFDHRVKDKLGRSARTVFRG